MVRLSATIDGERTRARLRVRPWQRVVALGWALGFYGWEFWAYDRHFSGPHAGSAAQALIATLLAGPIVLLAAWALGSLTTYGRVRVRRKQVGARRDIPAPTPSLQEVFERESVTYAPVALLALSPLFYALTGQHSTSIQAAVVVLATLAVAGVAGLKAWTWRPAAAGSAADRAWRPAARTADQGTWRAGAAGSAAEAGTADDRAWGRLVWAALALSAGVSGALAIARYNAYNTWGVDVGLLEQALWNTLHGGGLMHITYYGGVQTSLLAFHCEPIFLLFLPLYLVWPDPRGLFAVQALVVALGAWPLFRLAALRLGDNLSAACLALAYLAFPAVITAGMDSGGSVRSDTLALPILLWALYFLEQRRTRPFLAALVLAMLCKEYVSLAVIGLGIYLLWRGPNRRLGAITAGLAAAYFAAVMWAVIPAFRGGQQSFYYGLQFGHLGGQDGLLGIVRSLLTRPGYALGLLLAPPKLIFVFFWFFSAGALAWLDLPALAGAAPILGMFLLLPTSGALDPGDHVAFVAIPFLFLATLGGLERTGRLLARRLPAADRGGRQAILAGLGVFLLASSLCAAFFWSPGPLSWNFWAPDRVFTYWRGQFVRDDHDRVADGLVARVPPGVPIVTSDYLLPRLAQRQTVYATFALPPEGTGKIDYAIVDLSERHISQRPQRDSEADLLRSLLTGGAFQLLSYQDGILLFQRGNGHEGSAAPDVTTDPWRQPQHAINAAFGDRLRLLGYDLPAAPWQAGREQRITYYWQIMPAFAEPFNYRPGGGVDEELHTEYVPVDVFSRGAARFRVIHLPLYLLQPPARWQAGQVIAEEYRFTVPDGQQAGAYDWQVALAAVPAWFGVTDGAAGQVPDSSPVSLGTIEVTP